MEDRVISNIDEIIDNVEITGESHNSSVHMNADSTELEENQVLEEIHDTVVDDVVDEDNSGTDSDGDSEYEEVDLTQNELYQVLSTFLESSDGYNISDILLALKNSIDENNQLIRYALTQNMGNSQ